MIVPMKKITVVVQSKDVEPTLSALRETGVLHIEHQNVPINESVIDLKEKHRTFSKAIEALPEVERKKSPPCNPEEVVSEILNLLDEKEVLTEDLKKIKKDIGAWEEWGDFDPEFIDDLKDKDIWVRLCKITKKEAQDLPEGVILERLFKKGNILYSVVISRKETDLPFHTLTLPEKGLEEMLASEKEEEYRIEKIDRRLSELSECKSALSSYKRKIESLIEFNSARAGMGEFKRLSYLVGYCPIYSVRPLERLTEREKWGILIENPGENDNPPTLIKNPKWLDIIRPVFNIIKTIPGYREIDISPHFLIFFSLFFGMLIGDMGYGAVYLLIGLFLHLKLKNLKDKSVFFLTYLLSICAMIWGLITGTFFGHHAWLKPMIPYFSNSTNVQSFCFFIGATQLSVAHLWRFLRKLPSLKALSDIGWVIILWCAYFLANTLILGKAFPVFGRPIFIIGVSLVILFTNPVKNIFKCIGVGLGELLLKLVSSFSDVVSYIRLFAVGMASVAIAGAFNQMAVNIGYDNILSSFLSFFVLFFGHGLNMMMGILAILVHGVRLNVLEFSSHLNMEWSGVEYAPFKGGD